MSKDKVELFEKIVSDKLLVNLISFQVLS